MKAFNYGRSLRADLQFQLAVFVHTVHTGLRYIVTRIEDTQARPWRGYGKKNVSRGVVVAMSDYGDFDEEAGLLVAEQAERSSPLGDRKSTRGVRKGDLPRGVHVPDIPEWANLVHTESPDTSDYESDLGVGGSRKDKVSRSRRMRMAGRSVTPDWIEVPKDKRYLFSKFSDFGYGPLTLTDWMASRPGPVASPQTPERAGVSRLCGNAKCSGQHSLAQCPFAGGASGGASADGEVTLDQRVSTHSAVADLHRRTG